MKGSTTRTLLVLAGAAASLTAPALSSALPVGDYSVPAARDTEPVVLTGKDFADWGTRSNVTAKAPLTDVPAVGQCLADDDNCDQHNNYAEPELDTARRRPSERHRRSTGCSATAGTRHHALRADPVPGRRACSPATSTTRRPASRVYSGEDQHTTYAYDREGFRLTRARPGQPVPRAAGERAGRPRPTRSPGLDDNDEIAFMARDAGPTAPPPTRRCRRASRTCARSALTDPTNPAAAPGFVYVAKAATDGPEPAFDADNGYVRYERDANADLFEFSESSYDNYGNAPAASYCDDDGNTRPATSGRRRPRDDATITTDRYRFRYDGRWLMTESSISPDGGATYGPDLVDRWKARAFAQDPASETPCCGYEEEDTNWGGSSTLLGERAGPVRAIRETWGADSGTNVIRRETFYRDEMRQKTWLRVHVIPPLDGIYAQWDFNAGRVTRFYNPAMSQ